MKNFILATFLFSSISSFSQDSLSGILPLENGKVTYTGVVQVDSFTINQLYFLAQKWFVKTYKSANDVVQLADKEYAQLIGKGNFKIDYFTKEPYINQTVSIFVKDGRYKYIISDFYYSDNDGKKFAIEDFPKSWIGKKKLFEKVDAETKLLIASLYVFMKTQAKDNW